MASHRAGTASSVDSDNSSLSSLPKSSLTSSSPRLDSCSRSISLFQSAASAICSTASASGIDGPRLLPQALQQMLLVECQCENKPLRELWLLLKAELCTVKLCALLRGVAGSSLLNDVPLLWRRSFPPASSASVSNSSAAKAKGKAASGVTGVGGVQRIGMRSRGVAYCVGGVGDAKGCVLPPSSSGSSNAARDHAFCSARPAARMALAIGPIGPVASMFSCISQARAR